MSRKSQVLLSGLECLPFSQFAPAMSNTISRLASQVWKRGWRERVVDQQGPEYCTTSSQNCVPSPKGSIGKRAEKRSESLEWKRSPRANPLCLPFLKLLIFFTVQHTRVYPYPFGRGACQTKSKNGRSDLENPLFLGFSVLRGGLRPWSRKGPDHGVGVDPETVNSENRAGLKEG